MKFGEESYAATPPLAQAVAMRENRVVIVSERAMETVTMKETETETEMEIEMVTETATATETVTETAVSQLRKNCQRLHTGLVSLKTQMQT